MIFVLIRLIIILLALANILFISTTTQRPMVCRVKSVKCEHVNPKIYKGEANCSIKPTRNGKGVTNVRYFYGKPVHDLWVQVKLFYRFSTGTQFRPWMVDVDVDVCKYAPQISELNGFLRYFAKSIIKNAPGLIHPCPYIGEEGLKDGDFDAIITETFPQIIPKGMYRLMLRFHLKNNSTFLVVWLTAHVDANDPMKAYDMG